MALEEMGFGIELDGAVADVVDRVKAAAQANGFGTLVDLDVAATLKAKIDHDRRDYRILGVCNPGLAAKALETAPDIGLFLPCTIVVYDLGEGRVRVRAFDPAAGMQLAGVPGLEPIGADARKGLQAAIESLAG